MFDVTWARLNVGEVLNVFGEGCDYAHTCLNLSKILLLMYPWLRWRCFLASGATLQTPQAGGFARMWNSYLFAIMYLLLWFFKAVFIVINLVGSPILLLLLVVD